MLQTPRIGYVIANFGGPRNLSEVRPFLESLLTDRDVIRNIYLPTPIHHLLFKYLARRRTHKVTEDYKTIGSKSPIYGDTEALANKIQSSLKTPVLTFHRYLPETHSAFINSIKALNCDEIRVLPMFPQFTYATTGSIARWFDNNLPISITNKIRWIKSYSAHPSFILAHINLIRSFLKEKNLKDEEIVLLFSAHGVPQDFIDSGDPYESECQASFRHVMEAFPKILGRLCYQSKFGRGEWIKPYTIDVCKDIKSWNQGKRHIIFVPISFTSDHIETLFEVEQEYMTVIRKNGLEAHRVPGLTLHVDWIQAILDLFKEKDLCTNKMLIRS